MVKVLCIGDQHFTTTNVDQIDVFLIELQKYLEEHDIDIIVSMGDLLNFHERIHTLSLKKATDYLHLLSKYCPVYVIVGNHDHINGSQYLTDNHWLYGFKTLGVATKNPITIVDKPILENIGDVKLLFCPYTPDNKFIDALNTIPKWQFANCIFAHQLINGAQMGSITVENMEKWEDEYCLVISGHVHQAQIISNVPKSSNYKGHFIYCGSIFNSFGDASKKRLLLADINNICINLSDVHLNLLQKSLIKINYEEINEFDYTEYKNTKLKLIITFDSVESWKQFKKSIKYKEIINYKIKIDPNINIDKNIPINTKSNNFNDILNELVISTNNNNVKNIYKNLLLNKIDIFDCDEIEL